MLIGEQKADSEQFQDIALPYLSFIYKSAYRLCGNPVDAEDLTQKTFLAAFEKFNQLHDLTKCKSWLFVILRNFYLKSIKEKKKYSLMDLDLIDIESRDYYKSGHYEDIREKYLMTNGEMQQVLNKLDEKYRTPLVLSYLSGFSYKEIAEVLKVPIGTVMSRIARGKLFLKKQLLDY